MDDQVPSDFETEARERLATMEAQHDSLDSKVEGLTEGQEEILRRLNDLGATFVNEEDFEPLEEKVEKNSRTRQRARTTATILLTLASVSGGLSGYVLFMM